MYFIMAFWYVVAMIGALSMLAFIVLVFSIFDSDTINRSFGYRNYLIILGLYALVAIPSAATLANGMNDGNFLFFLGCFCPAFWELDQKLTQNHQSKQLKILAAQMDAAAIPPMEPVSAQPAHRVDPGPAYVPAPSTLVADFDVPPQR